MQRNLYGALCRECGCGVGQREGVIYDSGRSNTVVCLSCLHDWYGESLDVRVIA